MRQLWRDPTPLTMTNDATGNDFDDPQKRKQIQQGVHAEPLDAQIWQPGHFLVEDQYRDYQYEILESLAQGGFGAT